MKQPVAPMTKFELDIAMFNEMYGLTQLQDQSKTVVRERFVNYKKILLDEVNEYDDLIAMLDASRVDRAEVLTALADLMGDIMVYCASEMRRFNLPTQQVLDIIMQSNLSKLGADGLPIKNEFGKVMKGPGYWKPEPKIKELIQQLEI
jgi:predicted HAD superfamily Cof-like phosphohydrolase